MSVLLRHVQGARRGSPRRLRPAGLALIAVLAAGALSLLIGPAFASKIVTGTLGTTGSGAGQVNDPQGVAVNHDGTGGANAGDVYVVDSRNYRIDQFHADGSFVRAFGWGVKQGDVAPFSFDVCTDATGCQAGQAGAGAGQLAARAAGIAVDQANGNLYVNDQNNNRVEVFSATGAFEGAFGWGVKTGADALEFCTTASGCVAGKSGPGAGELAGDTPGTAIGSSGDVYVADQGNNRIDEFKPTVSGGAVTDVSFVRGVGWDVIPSGAPGDTGTGLEACTTASTCQKGASGYGAGEFANNTLQSIAVDSTGAIYAANHAGIACSTTRPCRVQRFTPNQSAAAGYSVEDFAPDQLTASAGSPGQVAAFELAVDPSNDHLIVAQGTSSGFKVKEFTTSGTGSLLDTSPPGTGISKSAVGLAAGPNETLYYATTSTVDVLGPPPAPTASILPVTNVGQTTATFNATVTPPAGGYDTTYHFEYSQNGVSWKRWPDHEVDVGSDHKAYSVSQQVVGIEPNATYEVRLVATTGTLYTSSTTTFTTSAAPPSISGTTATDVEQGSTKLTAYVNPNNSPTTYHFEWGTGASYGHEVPGYELFAGSGGSAVRVSANISGLQPNTTYHFRVVATNTDSGVADGPDRAFTTLNRAGLPDNRAYELVSPAAKGPASEVSDPVASSQSMFFQASRADGEIIYPLAQGRPGATTGGGLRYLASRGASGWSSEQLTPTMSETSTISGGYALPPQVDYLSSDLSCVVLSTDQHLAANAPTPTPTNPTNIYVRDATGKYSFVSTESAVGQVGGNGPTIVGVSDNCEHILLQFTDGLYEWRNGTLSNVGKLPDGSVDDGALAGYQRIAIGSVWHAIDDSGSRAFFTATSDEGNDAGNLALYVRKDDSTTVKVSGTNGGSAPDAGPFFQLASRDGSRVLFLANYGLASTTSAGATTANCTHDDPTLACDLYSYDVGSGTLTDLSADTNPADTDGATVAGVLGASDDATWVYFAAKGQLVAGKGYTYSQNLSGSTENIYLVHDGHVSFVAVANQADLESDNTGLVINRNVPAAAGASWASRVTPDGKHLVFASTANVTGYDSGGVAEAYLYSASSGATVCISCRQNGRPSVGDPVTTKPLQASIHPAGNYFHPPLTISADGSRVFFTMPDVLASGAVSGQKNVYEWHDNEVYLLAVGSWPRSPGQAGLVGVSASGRDVFVVTDRRLVPEDSDSMLDLYDVRVDGGFPVSARPSAPCDPLSGACQGSAGGSPAFGPIGSVSLAGVGNVTPSKGKSRARRAFVLRKLSRRARRHLARRGRGRVAVRIRGGGKVRVRASTKFGGHRRTVAKAKAVVHRKRARTVRLRLRLSHRAWRKLARRGRLRVRIVARVKGIKGERRRTVVLRDGGGGSKAGRAGLSRTRRAGRAGSVQRTVEGYRGGAK